MRFVIVSDTHSMHDVVAVPDGDVLIHAGDSTFEGRLSEVMSFSIWLRRQPHRHKVIIAGNHDWLFQRKPHQARGLFNGEIVYLCDTGVELEGVKFWGSPWQPWFHDWAFNLERGPEIAAKWALIPDDTNVLITHGPPAGYGDTTRPAGLHLGCEDLRERLRHLTSLRLHCFGHIHGGYGIMSVGDQILVNASICNEAYQPINQPVVIDL